MLKKAQWAFGLKGCVCLQWLRSSPLPSPLPTVEPTVSQLTVFPEHRGRGMRPYLQEVSKFVGHSSQVRKAAVKLGLGLLPSNALTEQLGAVTLGENIALEIDCVYATGM